MGLILDTSEFIFAERHGMRFRDLLDAYSPQTCGVSVMTLAEFQHGVRRAKTSEQRTRRESYLAHILHELTVFPVTSEIALLTGNVDAELAMRGEALPLTDLTIAATALISRFALATRNIKHFQRVPGLIVVSPNLLRESS